MRFKEYFLLRENPDHADFGEYTEDEPIPFWHDSAVTIIMTENIIYYAPTNLFYHDAMFNAINSVFERAMYDVSRAPFSREFGERGIKFFGEFDENFLMFIKKEGTRRFNIMNSTDPTILMARMWSLEGKGKGISFWDKPDRINSKHKDLLESFLQSVGYTPDKVLYEVTVGYDDNEGEDITEVMDGTEFKSFTHTSSTPSSISAPTPIHLLPPEQKKRALLAAGVKPKAVVPIQNRKVRSGD